MEEKYLFNIWIKHPRKRTVSHIREESDPPS